MSAMSLFEPDRYFSRLSKINIDTDLLACGYRFVLLDVDNTILSRADHSLPRDVGFWLGQARDAGIAFCLVSNNWHKSVRQLAHQLHLPLVAKAVKPLPPAFLCALRKLDAPRAQTLVIGDQLVTDVLGAHFLGMRAYLLAPLVEQDLPHTLMLRNVERALMGDRQPEGAATTSGFVPPESLSCAGQPGGSDGCYRAEEHDVLHSSDRIESAASIQGAGCAKSTDHSVQLKYASCLQPSLGKPIAPGITSANPSASPSRVLYPLP